VHICICADLKQQGELPGVSWEPAKPASWRHGTEWAILCLSQRGPADCPSSARDCEAGSWSVRPSDQSRPWPFACSNRGCAACGVGGWASSSPGVSWCQWRRVPEPCPAGLWLAARPRLWAGKWLSWAKNLVPPPWSRLCPSGQGNGCGSVARRELAAAACRPGRSVPRRGGWPLPVAGPVAGSESGSREAAPARGWGASAGVGGGGRGGKSNTRCSFGKLLVTPVPQVISWFGTFSAAEMRGQCFWFPACVLAPGSWG